MRSQAQLYYLTTVGSTSTTSTDAINKIDYGDTNNNTSFLTSGASSPFYFALDIANNRAFVYDKGASTAVINVINFTTGALINTISATTSIQAIKYDPIGDYLYYTTTDGDFHTQASGDGLWRVKPNNTGLTEVASAI